MTKFNIATSDTIDNFRKVISLKKLQHYIYKYSSYFIGQTTLLRRHVVCVRSALHMYLIGYNYLFVWLFVLLSRVFFYFQKK